MDYIEYRNDEVAQDFLYDQKFRVALSTPYTEVPKEIRGKVIL